MLRRLLPVGIVLAALGSTLSIPSPSAAAAPSAYQRVLGVYQSEGTVPACRFSGVQLADALKGVDTYGAQYFADFTQAVQSALSARAAGACAQAPAAVPVSPAGGAAEPPAHFGSLTAATSAGIPAPLGMMAALALAAGLFGAGAVLSRSRARR